MATQTTTVVPVPVYPTLGSKHVLHLFLFLLWLPSLPSVQHEDPLSQSTIIGLFWIVGFPLSQPPQNHGSGKNGCISNRIVTFSILQAFSTEPWLWEKKHSGSTPHPVTVTSRIVTFLVGKFQPKPFICHDCILASIHIYIYIHSTVTLATTVDPTPFRIPQKLFGSHPHLDLSAHRLVVDLAPWGSVGRRAGRVGGFGIQILWIPTMIMASQHIPSQRTPPRNKTSWRVNRWFPYIRPY